MPRRMVPSLFLLPILGLATSCGSGLAALGLSSSSDGSDDPELVVKSLTPASGSVGTEPTLELLVGFNRSIDPISVNKDTVIVEIGGEELTPEEFEGVVDTANISANGNLLTVPLLQPTRLATEYKITLTTRIEDKSGLNLPHQRLPLIVAFLVPYPPMHMAART